MSARENTVREPRADQRRPQSHPGEASLPPTDTVTEQSVQSEPEFVFNHNDPWSILFRDALCEVVSTCPIEKALEVGVGSGDNVASMLIRRPDLTVFASDYDPKVVSFAKTRVGELLSRYAEERYTGSDRSEDRMRLLNAIHQFHPIEGSQNLLSQISPETTQGKVPFICACIPQVRWPDSGDSREDARAHYYDHPDDKMDFTSTSLPASVRNAHVWGLGLNVLLLEQSKALLQDDGQVMLNLAGRVPQENLLELISDAGFHPRIARHRLVEQERGTKLDALVAAERDHGVRFRFYDQSGSELTATEAAEVQQHQSQNGTKLFHDLFVVSARLRPTGH